MARALRSALRPAAQDHRIARFQAERRGVGGDIRPALVDHADDADRRPRCGGCASPFGRVQSASIRPSGSGRAATSSRPRAIASTRAAVSGQAVAEGGGRRRCRRDRRRWPPGSPAERLRSSAAIDRSAALRAASVLRASGARPPLPPRGLAQMLGRRRRRHALRASPGLDLPLPARSLPSAIASTAAQGRRDGSSRPVRASRGSPRSRPSDGRRCVAHPPLPYADRPRASAVPSGARTTTGSPRSKLPSTPRTPAGSSERPEASARAAPASTESAPSGESAPAIQRLRAERPSGAGRNQVQRASCSSAAGAAPDGRARSPWRSPAWVAMRAAASLVRIPPDE